MPACHGRRQENMDLFVHVAEGRQAREGQHWRLFRSVAAERAQAKANEFRKLVEARKDPRDVANDTLALPTVSDLVDDYIRLHVRASSDNYLRTCMEAERRFDKNVIPYVGHVPVKEFRMIHLKRVLNNLMERNAPAEANKVYSDVKHMMRWAVRQGSREIDNGGKKIQVEYGLEFNPIADAGKPAKDKAKIRALTLDELRTLWLSAPGVFALSQHVPTILRVMIATGQRPGEVCGIHRDDIDTAKRIWTIPADKSKNGFEHQVPLNDLAYGLIMDALRETNGDLAFPNKSGEAFVNNALSRAVSRAFDAKKLDMERFTPHDLRRTVSTNMSTWLTLSDKYIGHVLNHRSVTHDGVTPSVYIQNPYLREKTVALNKWGKLLERLLAGETIVHIEEARAA